MQKFSYISFYQHIGGESELIYTDRDTSYLPTEKVTELHYHDRCEIGICRDGNGIWILEEKSYALSAGDVFVVPAGVPHYSRGIPTARAPRCPCEFLYFDEYRLFAEAGIQSTVHLTDRTVISPAVFTRHDHGALRFLLEKMIETVRSRPQSRHSCQMAAHWYSLFLLGLQELASPIRMPKPVQEDTWLPAIRKIMVDFADDLTLQDLADACSLSVCYFTTGFRKAYGIPPIRYLNEFRVGIAAQLLAGSDISITEISSFVGFTTPSELYRHFTAVYDMAPTEYRKLKRT